MDRSSARARVLKVAVATVVAAGLVGFVPTAAAQVVTCQGQAATVVGPTTGQDTEGTEGDDVIVAPLSSNSIVSALGGADTICLVDGTPTPSRDAIETVSAGAGDDLVVNETTHSPGDLRVELGAGVDHFVGADYREAVYGAAPLGSDTELDTFETRGGPDFIESGTGLPAHPNLDVIESGAGRDVIRYGGLAGGSIDNGPDADLLGFMGAWTGGLSIDNVAQHANLGGETVLSWTAVDGFSLRAEPGSHVSFAGSDAAESLGVSGTVVDLAAPEATIAMGGGNDDVRLENYLPASLDLGQGYDMLTFLACRAATIRTGDGAECETAGGQHVHTAFAGIESLFAGTTQRLDVAGTSGPDRLGLSATHVRVWGGRGDDQVRAHGRTVLLNGSRGDDRLKGSARGDGLRIFGGRGADVLRGDDGRDRLFGGRGRDVAYGKRNIDRCIAETRIGCERG